MTIIQIFNYNSFKYFFYIFTCHSNLLLALLNYYFFLKILRILKYIIKILTNQIYFKNLYKYYIALKLTNSIIKVSEPKKWKFLILKKNKQRNTNQITIRKRKNM